MKIQIETQQDIITVLQAANFNTSDSEEYKSLAWVLASFASLQVPDNQDFECVINTALVKPSHRSNPSAYSLQIAAKTDGRFLSSSGHATDSNHITILLMRADDKSTTHKVKFCALNEIKRWLSSSSQIDELSIETSSITRAYLTRPEQLSYKIKRETGQKIKIKRLKTIWKITRKS